MNPKRCKCEDGECMQETETMKVKKNPDGKFETNYDTIRKCRNRLRQLKDQKPDE